jgi:putative DNA primase/helicase
VNIAPDAPDARDALAAIPADLPRDTWVRVGMAAQAAGLGFDDFDAWSAQGDSYDSRAARDTWRSFEPGKGISAATLFHIAGEYGYRRSMNGHGKPPARPVAPSKPARHRVSAAEVLARFQPATVEHPYIAAKGGLADGLRVVPAGDPLRIAGQSVAGWLAVPSTPLGGIEPTSVQFIPAPGQGKKLNLPGSSMDGVFIVGELQAGGTAYLCEGIGHAWACWKATGQAALCCFSWGNVGKRAAELRRHDSACRIVLVPDTGKEGDAERIAGEVGAAVARMPDGSPQNFDVNDYAQAEGVDALECLLAGATEPPTPNPAGELFNVVPVADLAHVQPEAPAYWWAGYLPAGVVTLLGAHGGVGKSTLALMLLVCVAAGRELFGKPVRQGVALYFSGEDPASLVRYRLHTICRAMGVDPASLTGRLHILDATAGEPVLFHEATAQRSRVGATTPTYAALAEYIEAHGVDVLVVDNASDAFDASEIARSMVRAFMRALARIAQARGGAVLLLAHVDKATARGLASGADAYSGSTAWHNSARSRLYLRRDADGSLMLEHQKLNVGGKPCDPLRLIWPEGGIPVLDAEPSGIVGAINERNHLRAVLKLIQEFTERGEPVSTATTSRTHAGRLLRGQPGFPQRLTDPALFDMLRQAERRELLKREHYRTATRKPGERWLLTLSGMAEVGIAPTAPTAPTSAVGAPSAEGAEACADCADFVAGGTGGKERTQVAAPGGAA